MTALWAILSGAASKAGEYLITWEVPSGAVLIALIAGAGGMLYVQGRFHDAKRTAIRTVRDTVQRQITRTDTVTETKPVRVTVYDTVEQVRVDTQYVPVPRGFEMGGVVSPSPVDISGTEVRLTEWRPTAGRFVQSTYQARPRPWALQLRTDLTGTTSSLFGAGTVGVRYRLWEDTHIRVAGGYGAAVMGRRASAGPIGRVSVTTTLARWSF
jgi:hypothetical protein